MARLYFFSAVIASSLLLCSCYYVPGTYPREFETGEVAEGQCNRIGSLLEAPYQQMVFVQSM
jgi:hypothetical protein